jgi:hypothetical protein
MNTIILKSWTTQIIQPCFGLGVPQNKYGTDPKTMLRIVNAT